MAVELSPEDSHSLIEYKSKRYGINTYTEIATISIDARLYDSIQGIMTIIKYTSDE